MSIPGWKPKYTEYTRVQSATWLSDTQIAVGRWDGSLSVFNIEKNGFAMVAAQVSSDGSVISMVASLGGGKLIYGDSATQLAIWEPATAESPQLVQYNTTYGDVNSAVVLPAEQGAQIVVTGHAKGYVLIWDYDGLTLRKKMAVDVRSEDPVQSPWPAQNVYGLAYWKGPFVIAGADDGDLTIINVLSGKVTLRQRYNPDAQRGINNISVVDDYLLLANCSVGPDDNNLWFYHLSDSSIKLIASTNLIEDSTREQAFNFDADLVKRGDHWAFYSSTEEGFLWAGLIVDDDITVEKRSIVASDGGAFIDINPDQSQLIAAARKLFVFELP